VNTVNERSRWPTPEFDDAQQPHFLFLITPPYSGSTAISKLLNSSPRTMILRNNGEGQKLIPGLAEKDRWEPNKEVDYFSVKSVWLNTFQNVRSLMPDVDVVIEKSPPNMMRIEQLASQFKRHSFVANNRNPYANCASILYRVHDVDSMDSSQRQRVITQLAEHWLTRSIKIRELILRLSVPLVTYEEFCQNPAAMLLKLELPDGVVDTIDLQAKVKVKDYDVQGIVDQNNRQISQLTAEDIESITHVLEDYGELLSFFGYKCMNQTIQIKS